MGDPACWFDQQCPDCAAMLETPVAYSNTVVCWRCGAQIYFGDDPNGPEVQSDGA